jgi:hypothetical protein
MANINWTAEAEFLVPNLRLGMPSSTLCENRGQTTFIHGATLTMKIFFGPSS